MKVFSLKSCDTCKKALKWLNEKGITSSVHDVRADGLSREDATSIVNGLGWESALNRRSTTWRGLSDDEKSDLDDAKAISLIVEHPTLMKRPVFVSGDDYLVGFDSKTQSELETRSAG